MKYGWPITFFLIFTLLVATRGQTQQATKRPSTSPVQTSEPNLDKELAQAQQTADRFIQSFKATRDITPLVAEMFTNGGKKIIEEDLSWSGTVGVGRSLVEHLNREERVKCFIAAFNLRYLLRLSFAGKRPYDDANNVKLEDFLSPEVVEFFKNQPASEMVKTPAQAQKRLAFYESAVLVMRKEVARNPPEETAQFKQNLVAFEAHLKEYKEQPRLLALDKPDKFGHPAGTLMARFIIPFHLALMMVKENGTYRIWFAMTDIPPD